MKSGAWAAQFPGLHPGYELQRPHVHEAHSHIAMSEVKRTTELPLD